MSGAKMTRERSKRNDKFIARARVFALQNFAPFWKLIDRWPAASRFVNKKVINTACDAAAFRPHPMSAMCDYVSWPALTDKTYLARSIPPAPPREGLPSVEQVTQLFMPEGEQQECPKSTLLFPIFAQYLTDGFLRTDLKDRARTTSNHDIDLSPLYGRTPAQTLALREKSSEPGRKGRLKSQMIEGEEFPPYLYCAASSTVDECFVVRDAHDNLVRDADGHFVQVLDVPLSTEKLTAPDWVKRRIFAVGGDRVNSNAMVAMMNALFLREHNRLAGVIEREHPGWDDTRVFETARNIVIAMFIKLVVEEYINHISSACFPLKADPRVAWPAKWNRPNWMTVEFSLLYRWHSLVPEKMHWEGGMIDTATILLDNSKLVEVGLARAFQHAGHTRAARLGLHNTAIYLEKMLTVESLAIKQNRDRCLDGFNAYRKSMGMNPVDGFDCMTGNTRWQEELARLYGTPDAVDFYVGLFAEDPGVNTPMPPLLGAMVALDAFSQALNNPLLSQQVFNERTFTPMGMETIERTGTLWDMLSRNLGAKVPPGLNAADIHMTRADWKRRWGSF